MTLERDSTIRNPIAPKGKRGSLEFTPRIEELLSAKISVASIAKAIGSLVVLAAIVAGGQRCANEKATEAGAKARATLASALPENSSLSDQARQALDCITTRVGARCSGVQQEGIGRGTDDFEKTNCDSKALDATEKTKGPGKEMAALAAEAKKVAATAGIITTFNCESSSDGTTLKIDAYQK
jgi:hypothetical protein